MVDEKTHAWFRGWREAANILAINSKAKVKCPECGIGTLLVKDVLVKEQNKLDRYMQCDNCSQWNVMTMEIPDNYLQSDKIMNDDDE